MIWLILAFLGGMVAETGLGWGKGIWNAMKQLKRKLW
jgi:hypothetical protein